MSPTLAAISFYVDQFYRYPLTQELAFTTIRDSLSTGQMKSKVGIVNFCKNQKIRSEKAVFVAHWHSLLALMMHNEGIVQTAMGVEKSQLWSDFSNYLNRDWSWKGENSDIIDFKIPPDTDLVVNTSCEHMSALWLKQIPKGCRVLLQSTNFEHLEHINKKESLEDFKTSLVDIDITSMLEINCDVYSRYTVFGIKK